MNRVITTSAQAFHLLRHLGRLEVEEFWILALHSNKRLIGMERVFRGTVDACPIHPRDVFRTACRLNAACIIIAHNHPSGDPTPSASDLLTTRELKMAGQVLQIQLLDHLVVAGSRYWSFADQGFKF